MTKKFKEFLGEAYADRKKKKRKIVVARDMLNLLFQKSKSGRRLES